MSKRAEVQRLLQEKGSLPHCTDIGGYPLYYIVDDQPICSTCANKQTDEVEACEVNWESNIDCEECSQPIDSAYDPPEEDGECLNCRKKINAMLELCYTCTLLEEDEIKHREAIRDREEIKHTPRETGKRG